MRMVGEVSITEYLHLVEKHFASDHTVEAYAARLGVTAGHLNDMVKAYAGQTAGSLIRRRLAIEAQRLLAHSDWSVKEIAAYLNFLDPAYFGRFFRREVGKSPGAFRANFREKYHAILG